MASRSRATPGRVLLLGATSGIVRAIAAELAGRGYDLILAGREIDEVCSVAADLQIRFGIRCDPVRLDALDFNGQEEALGRCMHVARGELSGVVIGIGFLGDQKEAEADAEAARKIVDSNYTAPVLLLERLARELEMQRHGFICVLSSVAGDRGRQSNYLYGSAKAGLSAYLQGLRNRLHPSGVRVLTVKPGFVDTSMTFGMPGLFLVASPERVARTVVRAIERGRDEIYVPGFWAAIMWIIRSIPESIFKRLKL